MTVDGGETETPNGTREGIERAAHVDGLDRDEDADRRRQAQHERSAWSTRRSVSAETSSPNARRAPPTSRRYRAWVPLAASRGINSTRALATGGRTFDARRFAPASVCRLSRFNLQARRERPSTPCARA